MKKTVFLLFYENTDVITPVSVDRNKSFEAKLITIGEIIITPNINLHDYDIIDYKYLDLKSYTVNLYNIIKSKYDIKRIKLVIISIGTKCYKSLFFIKKYNKICACCFLLSPTTLQPKHIVNILKKNKKIIMLLKKQDNIIFDNKKGQYANMEYIQKLDFYEYLLNLFDYVTNIKSVFYIETHVIKFTYSVNFTKDFETMSIINKLENDYLLKLNPKKYKYEELKNMTIYNTNDHVLGSRKVFKAIKKTVMDYNNKSIYVVSLGNFCQSSASLTRLGFNENIMYPFDFIQTDIKTTNDLISNNCKDLLDKKKYIIQKNSLKEICTGLMGISPNIYSYIDIGDNKVYSAFVKSVSNFMTMLKSVNNKLFFVVFIPKEYDSLYTDINNNNPIFNVVINDVNITNKKSSTLNEEYVDISVKKLKTLYNTLGTFSKSSIRIICILPSILLNNKCYYKNEYYEFHTFKTIKDTQGCYFYGTDEIIFQEFMTSKIDEYNLFLKNL